MNNLYGTTPVAGQEFQQKPVNEMTSLVDALNDLIANNRGIIDVYQTAAKRLQNEVHAKMLTDAAARYQGFVTELSNLVLRYSGTPYTSAGAGSMVKRAWVVLKATVTDGDGPIVEEVAQDAQNVVDAYNEAMKVDLPDDVRDLLSAQLNFARLNHEKLAALGAVIQH